MNAGAWGVAILCTFAPSPFIDERSPIPLVAALYVVAGILMAVTFACLTAGVARSLFFPHATRPVTPRTPFQMGGVTPYLDRVGASERVFGDTFHHPPIRGVGA